MDLVSAQIGGSVSANAASAGAASAASATGSDFASRTFGLSMRFAVTFTSGDGITNLGEWSSCKGLKVEFKTEPVKFGGEYDYEVKLPTQVTYGPVTLERAMDSQSSQKLQAWLGRLVTSWMSYDESRYPYPMGTVTIALQDANQKTVTSWTLLNAYPTSWSGPTLDAKGNAVALETLTLEHQGFLPPESGAGTGA